MRECFLLLAAWPGFNGLSTSPDLLQGLHFCTWLFGPRPDFRQNRRLAGNVQRRGDRVPFS